MCVCVCVCGVRVCTHKQTHCTFLEHVYSALHFLSLDQWEESKEDTKKNSHVLITKTVDY